MKHSSLSLVFTLIFLITGNLAPAQSRIDIRSQNQEIEAVTHQPVDLVFEIDALTKENPFDRTFGANFIAENGSILTVNGFYDGGREYVLRFTAEAIGNYRFKTFSAVPGLSGFEGNIRVTVNPNPDIHGPIQVSSKEPQKFSYSDGQPYFALAFELDWLFALDVNTKKGIPKTAEIIQSVKKNGFNQVVMNVYAYDVGWPVAENVPSRYSFKKPEYSVFGGNNENPDFSQLNVSFFQHLDRVIQHLNEQGIAAHLMIYVWNKKVNWPAMYSTEDNRYFDYVIKRYQAYPNIIWDVSKEALDYGRCDIPYINERIERIRRLDAYRRLVTVHDYEYCSREPDKVDFISIQNWRSDLYSLSMEALLNHPDKPVMNIEHGGYEKGPYQSFVGNYNNPEVCLERNYESVFAGVYSTYYWQNTAWDIVIYDALNRESSFPKPRFDYYKHLHDLFTRFNYNSLVPYKPKLTTNGNLGNDNLSTSGYPLTDNQGLFLYFVPGENDAINIVIPRHDSGKIQVSWFNIFTGETHTEPIADWYLFRGFKSPWENQSSVLIIKGS